MTDFDFDYEKTWAIKEYRKFKKKYPIVIFQILISKKSKKNSNATNFWSKETRNIREFNQIVNKYMKDKDLHGLSVCVNCYILARNRYRRTIKKFAEGIGAFILK